jgi:hypothetical protein
MSLANSPGEDVKLWKGIYSIVGFNVSLVDRTGWLKLPFNFGLYEPFRLPTALNGFSASYEDCCDQRAQEILAIQQREQVPIALLYSGGIDSTLVLTSFAKLLGKELKDRVTVFMSTDSIKENPNFYYSFIRKNCRLDSSEKFSYVFDGSHIIVGGEHNDQLFGSDIIATITRARSFEDAQLPCSRENVTSFFRHEGMEPAAADVWFDLLSEHARGAPLEIKTIFDFFWWLNFIFKWQNVYFRMLLHVNRGHHHHINQGFVEKYYHHFFSAPAFQKWAMLNKDLKIKSSWKSYKFPAKEIINNFSQDRDYLENKVKVGSLCRLFVQKQRSVALTSDYEFLPAVNPADFYNPGNSFVPKIFQ